MILCTKLYRLKVSYKAYKLLHCWLLVLIRVAMKSFVIQTPNFVGTNPFVLSSLTLRRLLSQILNKIKEEATRCKRSNEKVDQKNKTVMKTSNVSKRIPKTVTHSFMILCFTIENHSVLKVKVLNGDKLRFCLIE